MKHIHKQAFARVHNALSADAQAYHDNADGSGGGTFLEGPPAPEAIMPGHLWAAVVRLCLGMPAAAYAQAPAALPRCRHASRARLRRGHQLQADELRPVRCLTGGGAVLLHGAMGESIGSIVRPPFPATARYEERAPELDRAINGVMVKAKLDVVYQTPSGAADQFGVSLVSACAGSAQRRRRSARAPRLPGRARANAFAMAIAPSPSSLSSGAVSASQPAATSSQSSPKPRTPRSRPLPGLPQRGASSVARCSAMLPSSSAGRLACELGQVLSSPPSPSSSPSPASTCSSSASPFLPPLLPCLRLRPSSSYAPPSSTSLPSPFPP